MAQKGFKRKLTAILSADVVAYSRLMREDEEATVRDINSHRILITDIIEQNRGRVIDSPGDNILAEFGSVVDAVNGAVKIQQAIKDQNINVLKNRQMEFRIGINLGDVIEEGDHIYGDGVNIAARLEGLAAGGGITISGTVYEHIKNKLLLGYHYLGEQNVKNISEPIQVYRLLTEPTNAGKLIGVKKKSYKPHLALAIGTAFVLIISAIFGGLYWKYFYLPTPENIDPQNKMAFDLPKGPSIAVLPFDNMSKDPEQEIFCDGITDNLIANLSQIPRLFVISRKSTFAYKGKSIKIQQIGHELDAKYAIEGSIQKSMDKIRITVQLVETFSGSHIWSEIYNRKMEDIFKLQDEITLEILKAMQITLTEGEKIHDQFEGVNDLKLWLKMSKATNLYSCLNPMSNHMAQREALEIIEMNPNMSAAHSLLGWTYVVDLWFDTCKSQIKCLGKATEAVRKAIELDEMNSEAHSAAAYLFLFRRQYEKAISEAKNAISLSPNNADAYNALGLILNWAERPYEGIEFIKKAIRLNPIPNSQYLNSLGNSYLWIGDYPKAVKIFEQAIKLNPDLSFAYSSLAGTYILLDRDKEARIAAKELLKIRPDFSVKTFVSTMPFKNKDKKKLVSEVLLKAGLPE